MTVRELIKMLAEWEPDMKVELDVAYHSFPILSHWTKGGTKPHTLCLVADTDMRVAILTREEREELDRRHEAEDAARTEAGEPQDD